MDWAKLIYKYYVYLPVGRTHTHTHTKLADCLTFSKLRTFTVLICLLVSFFFFFFFCPLPAYPQTYLQFLDGGLNTHTRLLDGRYYAKLWHRAFWQRPVIIAAGVYLPTYLPAYLLCAYPT
jgi:hypothetical protein